MTGNNALSAGDAAFGLSTIKPGFGRTPEDDRLLALGYPHMLVPTDEIIDWGAFSTVETLLDRYPIDVEVPGQLIHWITQNAALVGRADLWSKTAVQPPQDRPVDLVATITAQEIRCDKVLYALEAVYGSAAVVRATVETARTWDEDDWEDRTGAAQLMRSVHFLLVRCSTDDRAALTAELERLFEEVKGFQWDEGGFYDGVRGLDIALHGRLGVERSGYRPNGTDLGIWDLPLAHDDPAFVASVAVPDIKSTVARDHAAVDVRLAFLGGDDVIRAMCERVDWMPKPERKRFIQQMGRLSHEAVRPSIEQLATLAGSKREAKAWLQANPA